VSSQLNISRSGLSWARTRGEAAFPHLWDGLIFAADPRVMRDATPVNTYMQDLAHGHNAIFRNIGGNIPARVIDGMLAWDYTAGAYQPIYAAAASRPHMHWPFDRNAVSVSVWAKAAGAPAAGDVMVSHCDNLAGAVSGYHLGWDGVATARFAIDAPAANKATAVVTPTEWNHYLGTYDGRTIRIWANGIEGTADAYAGPMGTPAPVYAYLATAVIPPAHLFNGYMRDVRIYARALGPGEAMRIFCDPAYHPMVRKRHVPRVIPWFPKLSRIRLGDDTGKQVISGGRFAKVQRHTQPSQFVGPVEYIETLIQPPPITQQANKSRYEKSPTRAAAEQAQPVLRSYAIPGVAPFGGVCMHLAGRFYIEARGKYRIFNDAEYRFYYSNSAPPEEGATPDETSSSLPHTTADTFADGTWYLSVSFFNGVIDSGFLPVGPNGETYLRLDVADGAATGSPPNGPNAWHLERRSGGVIRVCAWYVQTGSLRADQFAITYTTDDGTPGEDDPDGTSSIVSGGLAVLQYDLPAQDHGTPVTVRLQTRRNDGTAESPSWVYSEGSSTLSKTADAEGPSAPPTGENWAGPAPEESRS